MINVARATLWMLVIVWSAAILVAMPSMAIGIDLRHARSWVVLLPALIALALRYSNLEPEGRTFADIAESFGLLAIITQLGGVSSYLIAATSTGYVDDRLAGIDQAIGFDWPGLYRFLLAHPQLARLSTLAYCSIFVTPIVVLLALGLSGRGQRARAFVMADAIALAITLVLFHFFPARGALAHYIGLSPPYLPASGLEHVAIIARLRGGAMAAIDPGAMVGLISFPSFHIVSGTLFIWGIWPMRRWRIPVVSVTLAMMAATPIEGAHYLVDAIGGVLVALLSIGVLYAPAIWRGQQRFGATRSWIAVPAE